MKLKTQRRLAAEILKCGLNRVQFDTTKIKEIKEAITRNDIRHLINLSYISKKKETGISRFRARKKLMQKRKGRQQGKGSRKGKLRSRLSRKRAWINLIRGQRDFLKRLRDKSFITKKIYRDLYLKSKGGFFRSVRHIKLYLDEHHLISKKKHEKQEKKIVSKKA